MNKENMYRILKPIAKLFVKLGTKCPDAVEILEKAFVEEASKVVEKINYTNISARTGIDRRKISSHLKGEQIYTPPDKLNLVARELEKFTDSGKFDIPQKGKNSFETVLANSANGRLTVKSALSELERTGRIKIVNNKVRFITTVIDGGISNDKLSQTVGDAINFVCETAQYAQTVNDNKLMYWWTYSKQIPPELSTKASDALYEQSVRHRKENFDLLVSFETTRFEKYPAIGLMQTQYDFNYYK